MKKWSVIILAALLSACDSSLDGTYTDENGYTSLTFNNNGTLSLKAKMFGIESEQEMKYKVEDGKVKVEGRPGEVLVMTINEDGSIYDGTTTFTKKD